MTQDSIDRLLERFFNRDRAALARLLSYVENDQPLADQIIDRIYPKTGRAHTIGVTGPPGGGKSTLVNNLIQAVRARGETIAVIAIDPSSAISGGAALGDRIRMLDTWDDPDVYVRSMATRGQLGGLSLSIASAVHVLDAYGFDLICIETVGVGQAEVDIARIADTTVLVQVPGLGDSVQLLKAGVLEIADVLVVNKSDRDGAPQLARDLQFMVRSGDFEEWAPPVVRTTASTGDGIDDLLKQLDRHREHLEMHATADHGHVERAREELRQRVLRTVHQHLDGLQGGEVGTTITTRFASRELTPSEATRALTEMLIESFSCQAERDRRALDPD